MLWRYLSQHWLCRLVSSTTSDYSVCGILWLFRTNCDEHDNEDNAITALDVTSGLAAQQKSQGHSWIWTGDFRYGSLVPRPRPLRYCVLRVNDICLYWRIWRYVTVATVRCYQTSTLQRCRAYTSAFLKYQLLPSFQSPQPCWHHQAVRRVAAPSRFLCRKRTVDMVKISVMVFSSRELLFMFRDFCHRFRHIVIIVNSVCAAVDVSFTLCI